MNGASRVIGWLTAHKTQKPLLSPSAERSDLASREPKVGRPLGDRIRAVFQRVFSPNQSSKGFVRLEERQPKSAPPLPSRKAVAAPAAATGQQVGALPPIATPASEKHAVDGALKDVPDAIKPLVTQRGGSDAEFRETVHAAVQKMDPSEVRAMYANLVNLEKSGKSGPADTEPSELRLLKLELLAAINPAEAAWLEKFGSPKPESPDALLADPASRPILQKFLAKEFSPENLEAFEFLEKALSASPSKETAQQFFDAFAREGADSWVNISAEQRKAVQNAASGNGDVVNALGAAHKEVAKLMLTDSIPRLLRDGANLEGLT